MVLLVYLLHINEIFSVPLWEAHVYSSMHLSSLDTDKTKESPLFTPQSGPYSSSGGPSSISTSGPGLSSSMQFGKSHRPMVSPMMLQRQEEDRWLGRQRADRHGQEFQQQEPADQREIHRSVLKQNSSQTYNHHDNIAVVVGITAKFNIWSEKCFSWISVQMKMWY